MSKEYYYSQEQVHEIVSKARIKPSGGLSVSFPTPALVLPSLEVSADELWDKHSETIGDSIDDLNMWSGKIVMERNAFIKAMHTYGTQLLAQCVAKEGDWINAKDVKALALKLDIAMNGKYAAKSPSLCDVVSQAVDYFEKSSLPAQKWPTLKEEKEKRDELSKKWASGTVLSEVIYCALNEYHNYLKSYTQQNV